MMTLFYYINNAYGMLINLDISLMYFEISMVEINNFKKGLVSLFTWSDACLVLQYFTLLM